MTLPTSRRPPEVEVWLQECIESGPLILRINRQQCFMDEMNSWFEFSLNERQKREVTKKRIIRRAMNASFKLSIDFKKLPQDWLKVFCERYDIDLKISKRRKYSKVSPTTLDQNQPCCSSSNGATFGDPAINSGNETPGENLLNGNIKDLTMEPPPKEWLGPYLRGQGWPRKLCSHKNAEGVTIIYYDYTPTEDEKSNSGKVLQYPHDLDKVFPPV